MIDYLVFDILLSFQNHNTMFLLTLHKKLNKIKIKENHSMYIVFNKLLFVSLIYKLTFTLIYLLYWNKKFSL